METTPDISTLSPVQNILFERTGLILDVERKPHCLQLFFRELLVFHCPIRGDENPEDIIRTVNLPRFLHDGPTLETRYELVSDLVRKIWDIFHDFDPLLTIEEYDEVRTRLSEVRMKISEAVWDTNDVAVESVYRKKL